jgi:hypothetical protein
MNKNRGDEPFGVIIHTHVEISQGTPCVATFISNKKKCQFFSSTKSENSKGEQALHRGRSWYSGRGGGKERR